MYKKTKNIAFLSGIFGYIQKKQYFCAVNVMFMKRIVFCILFVALNHLIGAQAVNYCASQSWGYAGNVTGGGNASPTLVTSESELKNALKNNSVVIIVQDITVSNQVSIENKSAITLMALPGKKLISTSQSASSSGILAIKTSTNIILRNITFEGPGAYDIDGRDNLTVTSSQNIWVDHCDFQDGCDGNFDINRLSDNISVTWCRFRYLKAPKAGGLETDDHRFSNLIGSSSTDKPSDGTYNITYAFCWWDEGCKQRMTRCRNCELHFLNCYWNSSVADYYVGPENAKCYFEGCTFAGKANSAKGIWNAFNSSTNYCTFVNCTGNLPANTATAVAAPTYSYDQLTPATAKNYVTNASCGAGATLTVTNEAKVSSSCDSDTPVDPQPLDTIIVSGDCCVDLSLGEVPTVANGGIPADFGLLSVTTNMTKSTWDQGFLNLGGNADYITFDFSAYSATIAAVEFDVTIPNWTAEKNTIAYHWNSEANSTYIITSAAKQMVTLQAPADAKSFTIQRSAGTSTRISKVCFEIIGGTSGFESLHPSEVSVQKIIREGQLLILRDNKTYNLTGARVY